MNIKQFSNTFILIFIYSIIFTISFFHPDDPKKYIFYITNLPASPLSEQIGLFWAIFCNYILYIVFGLFLNKINVSCKSFILYPIIIINSIITDGISDLKQFLSVLLLNFPIFIVMLLCYSILKTLYILIKYFKNKFTKSDYIS